MIHGLFDVGTNSQLKWARQFHNYAGNVVFTDGSFVTTSNVMEQFLLQTDRTACRLAIP
jgi:hypothetical protein